SRDLLKYTPGAKPGRAATCASNGDDGIVGSTSTSTSAAGGGGGVVGTKKKGEKKGWRSEGEGRRGYARKRAETRGVPAKKTRGPRERAPPQRRIRATGAVEGGRRVRRVTVAGPVVGRKFSHPLPLFQELPWCTSRGSVAAMLPELPPPTPFLPLNIPPPSHLVLPGPLCKCEPTRPSLLVDPPYTSPLFYPFGSPGSSPPPANCLQLAAPKSKSAGAVHSE
ncbi:hypothetical protein X777_16106, partial [Ooceraea biroi]